MNNILQDLDLSLIQKKGSFQFQFTNSSLLSFDTQNKKDKPIHKKNKNKSKSKRKTIYNQQHEPKTNKNKSSRNKQVFKSKLSKNKSPQKKQRSNSVKSSEYGLKFPLKQKIQSKKINLKVLQSPKQIRQCKHKQSNKATPKYNQYGLSKTKQSFLKTYKSLSRLRETISKTKLN